MNLEGLFLIPTSSRGWTCAILLSLTLFSIYYFCMFPELHSFYFGRERGSFALYSSVSNSNACGPLTVRVDSPRQIAPFIKRWVYLTLTNRISEPITLTASLVITPTSGWYMPFLFGSSNIEALSFSPLAPYATAHGQIPLFSSSPDTLTLSLHVIYIQGNQPQECSIEIAQPPNINPRRTLIHSFVEQILLPPWSNWFLVGISFIIPALKEREEKKTSGHFLEIFRTSLMLSLFFIALILLVMSVIWWPEAKEPGGLWNFIFIIMGFIFIFIWGTLLNLLHVVKNKQKLLQVILFPVGLITFESTRFPLLKIFWMICLIAGALEFLRAIPWLMRGVSQFCRAGRFVGQLRAVVLRFWDTLIMRRIKEIKGGTND
jgi:hypothetical protein